MLLSRSVLPDMSGTSSTLRPNSASKAARTSYSGVVEARLTCGRCPIVQVGSTGITFQAITQLMGRQLMTSQPAGRTYQ
jgi:hypothetical protein